MGEATSYKASHTDSVWATLHAVSVVSLASKVALGGRKSLVSIRERGACVKFCRAAEQTPMPTLNLLERQVFRGGLSLIFPIFSREYQVEIQQIVLRVASSVENVTLFSVCFGNCRSF